MDDNQLRQGEQTLHVLYVCTANVARSPYADRRTGMLLAEHSIEVASAGVRARDGQAMDTAMAAELKTRGGSGQGHRSQQVDDALMATADLIITLGYSHHMDLLQTWPQHANRIVGLRQMAQGVGDFPTTLGADALAEMRGALPAASMALDVDDPWGRGKKAAALCALEIDAALDVVAPFLARVSGTEPRLVENESGANPKDTKARRFSWGRGVRGRTGH